MSRLVLQAFVFIAFSLFTFAQSAPADNSEIGTAVRRDPTLLDVLTRVVTTAGGLPNFAAVHDITETGDIRFYWSEQAKGPVTVRLLGGNHFRMEANLPEGKHVWVVKDGVGSSKDPDGSLNAMSRDNALNLGNLTFPIANFAGALADSATDVALIGIENQGGRSVYRLRVKGNLGTADPKTGPSLVTKDLLIDALSFDIRTVEDRPFTTYELGGGPSDKPSRVVEFSDFRVVNGLRIPFQITTKLMGQPALSIQLTNVTFNTNLRDQDFEN